MTHFAVTAIGADRPGIVAALSGALHELAGNLEDVASTILRGHFTMMLVVDVPTDAEALGASLAEAVGPLGVDVTVRDVEEGAADHPRATHLLSVYGSDRPGIVAGFARLLAEHGVNVTDLSCRRTTGEAPVYAMIAELAVPPEASDEVAEAVRSAAAELGVDVAFGPLESETL